MELTPSPTSQRRSDRLWSAAAAFAIALFYVLATSASAFAELKPQAGPRREPPMRFLRVAGADPACEPNCPEWLSAEGVIVPGTAQAFAETVSDLGGRRLPILIHSHGGSPVDAVKMGIIIRAKGLAVAVARTLMSNCPETASKCASGRGQAITGGAACASACVLVLAGGVERLVGPVPLVGVHQITAVRKQTEGVAHLTSTRKFYEPEGVDAAVKAYLTAMGVGEPVMTLLRKTPAASIRWLGDDELRASRLATLRLDSAAPILAEGANGLNGHAFEGDPPLPDLFTARGAKSLAPAAHGRDLSLEATFAYRRGGGAVEATIALRDAATKEAGASLRIDSKPTLAPEGGEVRLTASAGGPPMRVSLPLASFCRLAHGGRFTAAPVGAPAAETDQANASPPAPPISFDVSAMDGAKALFDEACP